MEVRLSNKGLGRLALSVAALTFCVSTVASAAGTARVSTMSSSGKRVLANIDFTSAANFRASAVLGGRPTLVVRDGRAYALVGDSEQPVTAAAQADALGLTRPNTGDEQIVNLVSIKATGRQESRAGFNGDIYDITFFDRSGRRRIEQIVVSSDPRARELTDLWRSVNDALLSNSIPQAGDLQKQLQANGLGLLRFSHRYQVDRLDEAVRLPSVTAYAPAPGAPVAPLGPVPPAMATADTVAPVAVPEDSFLWRLRRFTQGSIGGTLFGGG